MSRSGRCPRPVVSLSSRRRWPRVNSRASAVPGRRAIRPGRGTMRPLRHGSRMPGNISSCSTTGHRSQSRTGPVMRRFSAAPHYLPVARIRGPLHVPSLQDRFTLDALTPGDIARFGRQARRLVGSADDGNRRYLGPHENPAFSPDGRMLAVSFSGVGAALIDVSSGRFLSTYVPQRRFRVIELAFAPTADRSPWPALTHRCTSVRLRPNALPGHKKETWSLAFSPDAQSLASSSDDGTIKLWDVRGGRERATLEGHGSLVTTVAYSRDGALLASGGFDKTVRLWNASTGEPLATLRGHDGRVRSVAFSPDGRALASAGDDQAIRIWDLAHSSELSTPLDGHFGSVYSLAFSADGKTLYSGALDKTIRLWDWSAGPRPSCVADPRTSLLTGRRRPTIRRWRPATSAEQRLSGMRPPARFGARCGGIPATC